MVSTTKNVDYSSVPSTIELENNSNQNKYTVNRNPRNDGVTFSKLALFLIVLGILLLIALAIGLTILFYPKCTDATPTSAAQKSAITAVRLPTNLEPLHYRIQLMPFLQQKNFTTNGAVSITLNVKEDTNKIALNMYDIIVDRDSVKVKNLNKGSDVGISDQKYDNVSQIYTITLNENLMKDQPYELEIKFTGQLKDNMQGFYRSYYIDPKTNSTRWMASTQFSPIDARRAFPCFDEPSFKSKFTISIARPTNMTTISNMPKRATDAIVDKANWVWDHYGETPLMSSYLAAFVISDLEAYRYNSSGKLFTVWTRMKSVDQTRLVIDLSPRILEYFENYFDIKFPLPKIDLVAVPDFGFAAMENWGLITFRENVLLYDEKSATIEDKVSTVQVLAHEIAHQWFGNLVSPKWWDDIWLNEGFATYLQYFATNEVYPSWNIMDEFPSSEVYRSFAVDAYKSSHPISFDVINTDDIQQIFDTIAYAKGASVIRMLHHILGDQNFKLGLTRYLMNHKYGNVHHDDLWNSLSEQTSNGTSKIIKTEASLKDIMNSWIRQAGFPVITAMRNQTSKEVHVSQKRFLYNKDSEGDKTLWWVPISYSSDLYQNFNDTQPKFWLNNERETTFIVEADLWWLLNNQQTGYYIVNYDEQNWRRLIDNIMSFPSITRAQLISDSMTLARANMLDYDIPLRMLTNIGIKDGEVNFISYWAALDQVSYLHDMLISTSIYNKFKDFLVRIFNHAFTNIHLTELPSDTYIIQRIRKLVTSWACKVSGGSCVNQAQMLFRKWLSDPKSPEVPPNTQKVVICTALQEGGEAEWNLAYNRYIASQSVTEKSIILDSLGCSRIPWILSRYLDFILKNDTSIRKQDSIRVFKSVAENPYGYTLAFSYLRTNWKEINEHYGPAFGTVSKMVAALSKFMNSPFQLEEIQNFKNNVQNNVGASEQTFDRVIEAVKANIDWKKQSYASIEKWLNEQSLHYNLRKK